MSKKLLFTNPELQDGVQTTVRLGGKWLGMARPGDVLDVCRTGDEEIVLARVVVRALMLTRFVHIPETVLWIEHDKSCQTMGGLHDAMVRAYGPIHATALVTVIFFEQVPEA